MKAPNPAPIFACFYPSLCDIARKHGYALAIHGSLITDLDLIAIPWTPNVCSPEELKDALLNHLNACDYFSLLKRQGFSDKEAEQISQKINDSKELKPHNRVAWNLYLENGIKIDLSIIKPVL